MLCIYAGPLLSNGACEGHSFLKLDGSMESKVPDVQMTMVSSLAEHGDSFTHFNYNPTVKFLLFQLQPNGKVSFTSITTPLYSFFYFNYNPTV